MIRAAKWRIAPTILCLALSIPPVMGCSSLGVGGKNISGANPEPSPEERLEAGLHSWRSGDYEGATLEFSRLATSTINEEIESQARILLALLGLDPRNPDRDPSTSASLSAELLSDPEVSLNVLSFGEIIYLLALDLGADKPDYEIDLPLLPKTSLTKRLAEALGERDRLLAERTRLQAQLLDKEEEIEELKRELERIRKTLRPR